MVLAAEPDELLREVWSAHRPVGSDPLRRIVAAGGSGGLEAFQILAAGLPVNLDASVFVVLHIGANCASKKRFTFSVDFRPDEFD